MLLKAYGRIIIQKEQEGMTTLWFQKNHDDHTSLLTILLPLLLKFVGQYYYDW
jgi:hypothetical protein